jgi:hypothetical protein
MATSFDSWPAGTLLRLRNYEYDWVSDIEPWDELGQVYVFNKGTIFEFLDHKHNRIRVWCPAHQCYISNVYAGYFEKISKD